jgi:hypothetical protein
VPTGQAFRPVAGANQNVIETGARRKEQRVGSPRRGLVQIERSAVDGCASRAESAPVDPRSRRGPLPLFQQPRRSRADRSSGSWTNGPGLRPRPDVADRASSSQRRSVAKRPGCRPRRAGPDDDVCRCRSSPRPPAPQRPLRTGGANVNGGRARSGPRPTKLVNGIDCSPGGGGGAHDAMLQDAGQARHPSHRDVEPDDRRTGAADQGRRGWRPSRRLAADRIHLLLG